MQMLADRREQENTETTRLKRLSEGTMTELLEDAKMREGCLVPKEHAL